MIRKDRQMTKRCSIQWLNQPTEDQLTHERQSLDDWRKTAEPVASWFCPQVDDRETT